MECSVVLNIFVFFVLRTPFFAVNYFVDNSFENLNVLKFKIQTSGFSVSEIFIVIGP